MPEQGLIRTYTGLALKAGAQRLDEDPNKTSQRETRGLRDDVIARLYDRLSDARMGTEENEKVKNMWANQGLDFLHFMCDGEMSSDYGFGFKARDYFMCLSEDHKREFCEKCNKRALDMRSATSLVWLLESFPLDMKEVNKLNDIREKNNDDKLPVDKIKRKNKINEARQKLKGEPEQDGYGNGEKQIREEVENLFKGDAKDFKKWLEDLLTKCTNSQTETNNECNPDVVARFEILGHELRKYLLNTLLVQPNTRMAPIDNPDRDENKEKAKEFAGVLKTFLEKVGKKHHLEFGATDDLTGDAKLKAENQAAEIKLTIGQIGRAWGDATAALGLHPWELEPITITFSSVGKDWGQKDNPIGKTIVEQAQSDLDKQGLITWCDMHAPGAMWSQAANFDRYRNTEVILFVNIELPVADESSPIEIPKEKKPELAKPEPKKTDPHQLRVTFAELQLGSVTKVITLNEKYVTLCLDLFQDEVKAMFGSGQRHFKGTTTTVQNTSCNGER